MKIKCRLTHAFADLKVDEIETTVWPNETHILIENLLSVAEDLAHLGGHDLTFKLTLKTEKP